MALRLRPPGLRTRLFLISVLLIASAFAGAWAYLSRALVHAIDVDLEHDLASRADLAVQTLEAVTSGDAPPLGDVVRGVGRAARARATLIDATGRVLADSTVPDDRTARLDNHADRPEVRAALAIGHGQSWRRSATLRLPLLYVARRFPGPDGRPRVLRVAFLASRVALAHQTLYRLLLAGGLVGLLGAMLLSWLAVHLISRPLRDLTATARAMGRDLSARTQVRADGEFGALAAALDGLADGLATSIASLEHERDRLGAILEAMTEGVLVTDAQGRIVVANRALREMFLIGRDVVGHAPLEVVRSAELDELMVEAARTRASVVRELSIGGVRPRRVMAQAAPIEDPAHGVVAVLSDVTELRRLETMRRDFVANVSHELRTPVAAIRAATETLEGGALGEPEAAREFVAIVSRHATRLHRLVEDLLELSRIEARELKLSPEPLEVSGVVDRVLDLHRLAAEARGTTLVRQVDPTVARALADARALEMVLSNLVDNAIKYSPEGAHVTLRAALADGRVRLSVADDGPGIEHRHLSRIFERFYRVDPGRSRALGGTGLGLAIVKHLAEAMGSSVTVDSTVGRGTTFAIHLPAA